MTTALRAAIGIALVAFAGLKLGPFVSGDGRTMGYGVAIVAEIGLALLLARNRTRTLSTQLTAVLFAGMATATVALAFTRGASVGCRCLGHVQMDFGSALLVQGGMVIACGALLWVSPGSTEGGEPSPEQ